MSKSKKDYGYNKHGEKILGILEKDNFKIIFVEQKNASKNLEEYYRAIAKIMYKQALRESKEKNIE